MVQWRLRNEMGKQLSEYQYGYRPGRSTVDALKRVFDFGRAAKAEGKFALLVALDVRNALNSAPWENIDQAMENMRTPPYLRRLTRVTPTAPSSATPFIRPAQ